MVLKPDSRVNQRQGSNHSPEKVNPADLYCFKKIITTILFLPIFFKKINGFLTYVLSRVYLSFLLGHVKLILTLSFNRTRTSLDPSQPIKPIIIL